MTEKELHLEINGTNYKVVIREFDAYQAVVSVNDKKYIVGIKDLGIEQVADLTSHPSGPSAKVKTAPSGAAKKENQSYHRPSSVLQANSVVTPLPGLILKIFVHPGDTVQVGQPVLVLEAMKMENEITSNFAGVVRDINCREGESVAEGAVLVVLE
jgi:glutaconyl-CoA/methylmalonyl-CoA decarboxylase subunit gamma